MKSLKIEERPFPIQPFSARAARSQKRAPSKIVNVMNVVYLRPLPVIVALLFSGGTLRAESADALIAEGDLFYAKFQASEALKCYLPAEKPCAQQCSPTLSHIPGIPALDDG